MSYPSERTRLMSSFRGRMQLAAMDAAEMAPPDPWAGCDQLRGHVHKGYETLSSEQCLEALGKPERTNDTFCNLVRAMEARGWEHRRVVVGGRQARGFRRPIQGPGDTGTDPNRPGLYMTYLASVRRQAEAEGREIPDIDDEQYWRDRAHWHEQEKS
jgi:hypothetical protein